MGQVVADPYRLVRLHSANGDYGEFSLPRQRERSSFGPGDPSRVRHHRTLVRFNPSDYGLR